jgi:hypothetical protein
LDEERQSCSVLQKGRVQKGKDPWRYRLNRVSLDFHNAMQWPISAEDVPSLFTFVFAFPYPDGYFPQFYTAEFRIDGPTGKKSLFQLSS